jgi:hypothetical protein
VPTQGGLVNPVLFLAGTTAWITIDWPSGWS